MSVYKNITLNVQLNQALTISLLAHLCVYLLALLTPESGILTPRAQEIEVVYQNETPTKQARQLVTDPNEKEIEKTIDKLKEQAQLLSRITRRVQEQIVARNKDKTQNATTPSLSESAQISTNQNARTADQQNTENSKNRSTSDELTQMAREQLKSGATIAQPPIGVPMESVVGQNARVGVSSISDYIPEVREGGFTSLNTDQFVHYTFYSRINEQIRNRWVALIREYLDYTPQTEINKLAQANQLTVVEILLTEEGQFHRARIHQQSGSRDLDRFTVEAFRLASPLINPPSEMIESDGFIHLRYGFQVRFRPRYLASGSR